MEILGNVVKSANPQAKICDRERIQNSEKSSLFLHYYKNINDKKFPQNSWKHK